MTETFNIKNYIDGIDSPDFRDAKGSERARFIWVDSQQVANWFFERSFRERKTRETLYDTLHDAKVAKAINRVVKESSDDDEGGYPYGFASVLHDMVQSQRRKAGNDGILDAYEAIIGKILKKPIKELSKAAGIDRALAYELLVVLPTPDVIKNRNTVGIYMGRLARKLYLAEKHDVEQVDRIKTLRRIFKYLFGGTEYDKEIALGILMERRPTGDFGDLNVYSLLTVYALDYVEALDKQDARDFVTDYAKRSIKDANKSNNRNNNRASTNIVPRRVVLGELDKETYPTIVKAIKKVVKKDKSLKECF